MGLSITMIPFFSFPMTFANFTLLKEEGSWSILYDQIPKNPNASHENQLKNR